MPIPSKPVKKYDAREEILFFSQIRHKNTECFKINDLVEKANYKITPKDLGVLSNMDARHAGKDDDIKLAALFTEIFQDTSDEVKVTMAHLLKMKDQRRKTLKNVKAIRKEIIRNAKKQVSLLTFSGQTFPVKNVKNEIIPANEIKFIDIVCDTDQALSAELSKTRIQGLDLISRVISTKETKHNLIALMNVTDKNITIQKNTIIAHAKIIAEDLFALPYESSGVEKFSWLTDPVLVEAMVKLENAAQYPLFEAVKREEIKPDEVPDLEGTKLMNVQHCFRISTEEEKDGLQQRMKKAAKEFHESQEKDWNEFIAKIPDILKPVFIKHKILFGGDSPGRWEALRIRPVMLPVQKNIPQFLQPAYRPHWSPEQLQVVEDFILTNLSKGIIQQSSSNYASPLLIVKKPNNRGWRICCDFRKLNAEVFDHSRMPIPQISEIVTHIGNARVYSNFDISSAYWRAELHERSKQYTAFQVHQGELAGIYSWNFLPFGVKSAVSIFSSIMDSCFRGLKRFGAYWYLGTR